MSELFVNHTEVQSQSSAIANSTNAAEQSAANYSSQSIAHQGELDGAARFDTLQFNNFTRHAINAACEAAHKMRAHIVQSSQVISTVDRGQSRKFQIEKRTNT